MPDILIKDIAPEVLDRIKACAALQKHSLQTEMQIILQKAAQEIEPLSEIEVARKIRNSLKNTRHTDSAELLREDRNR